MTTPNDLHDYTILSTEDLEKYKKSLEAQLMYHNAAEGPAYWAEKEDAEKVKILLRAVNEELIKRRKILNDVKEEDAVNNTYHITCNGKPICISGMLNLYGVTCSHIGLKDVTEALDRLYKNNPKVEQKLFNIIKGNCPEFERNESYNPEED